LAIDGSTTDDIAGQVGCLPSDASHLVLSVGGNDALQQTHLLFTPASSTEEALGLLADLAKQFEHDYRAAIAHRLPVIDLRAFCTNPEDYANPIEPSSAGGEKIARAIAALAMGTSRTDGASRIIASDSQLGALRIASEAEIAALTTQLETPHTSSQCCHRNPVPRLRRSRGLGTCRSVPRGAKVNVGRLGYRPTAGDLAHQRPGGRGSGPAAHRQPAGWRCHGPACLPARRYRSAV
jgi:hypothetical protein